jgi:hypothetical protein
MAVRTALPEIRPREVFWLISPEALCLPGLPVAKLRRGHGKSKQSPHFTQPKSAHKQRLVEMKSCYLNNVIHVIVWFIQSPE